MGLHDGDEVVAADLPDAVHPVEAHQDTTAQGDASPDVANASATCGDRDAVFIGVG